MSRYYEGKERCAGCKKTGEEKPRWGKNDLCNDCEEQLRIGRARQFEDAQKYVYVRQHLFAFSSLSFDDKLLNTLTIDLLRSLDNPNAKTTGELKTFKHTFGDNCVRAYIPERVFESINTFLHGMNDVIINLRKELDSIPQKAKDAVREEKNRIYNEGIARGRNLLTQLNSGDITLDTLNQNYSYNEKP